jgi:hypothetical protein
MIKHYKYLKYLLKHKWHVGIACIRHGLIWRGIMHDWHKCLPSEWFPYTDFFYGREELRGTVIAYSASIDRRFLLAWLKHQKRGDHHWQYWILPMDNGNEKLIPMSKKARLEMVCDWYGASIAQGHGKWIAVNNWYDENKDHIKLHPKTKKWVETFLYCKYMEEKYVG